MKRNFTATKNWQDTLARSGSRSGSRIESGSRKKSGSRNDDARCLSQNKSGGGLLLITAT